MASALRPKRYKEITPGVGGEPEEEGSVCACEGGDEGCRPEAHYRPFTFLGLLKGKGVWGSLSTTGFFADMTFIHEGNHTLVENLINFEKMVSSRRVVASCWSRLGDMTMTLGESDEGGVRAGRRWSEVINNMNVKTYFKLALLQLHCILGSLSYWGCWGGSLNSLTPTSPSVRAPPSPLPP